MSEEKILHLIQKKRGFFEAILELSESEHLLPLSDWVSVLEQKRVLISCIEEIDAELEPFKDSLHSISQDVTDEIGHTLALVKKIFHIDQANRQKRKEELAPYVSRKRS